MKKILVSLFFVTLISTNILAQSSPSSVIFDSINNIIRSRQTIQLNCSMPSIVLTSKTFAPGATSSYVVDSIPYNPPCPYTISPNAVDYILLQDDAWSQLIDINYAQPDSIVDFIFSFYGQNNLSKCVIGSNGVLSFDTTVSSGINFIPQNYCSYSAGILIPSINPEFHNCIFGPYHDIYYNLTNNWGKLYFQVLGEYPSRIFVVSFYDVPLFGNTSLHSTHMIVLYETTNTIEFYMQNKPCCTSTNAGRATLGIQNATGTQATVVTNSQGITYNSTNWAATNEAWRIRPSGELNHSTQWYKRSVPGGNRVMLNAVNGNIVACPDSIEGPQYYIMETNIVRLDGDTILISDSCIVNPQTLLANSQYGTNIVASICNGETYTDYGFNENSEGTYTMLLQTSNGCDSTVTLSLFVDSLQIPYNLSISNDTNYIQLEWDGNGENYIIYRNEDSIANITERIYKDTNIVEGVSYCYKVKAFNVICESDLSVKKCGSLIGLDNEIENNISVSIYPNPTENQTKLEIQGLQAKADIIVYDLTGKAIDVYKLDPNQRQITLNFTGFAKGVFSIIIRNKDLNIIRKIIVR